MFLKKRYHCDCEYTCDLTTLLDIECSKKNHKFPKHYLLGMSDELLYIKEGSTVVGKVVLDSYKITKCFINSESLNSYVSNINSILKEYIDTEVTFEV